MQTFLLEIVTPERITFKDQVEFLAAPSYEGELGVLAGHTHLLTQLVTGLLRFRKEEKEEAVAITGGFLEVHPDRVAVFAETADMAEELDAERARQEVERAKSQIRSKDQSVDLQAIQASLRAALVRLKVAERIKRKPRI